MSLPYRKAPEKGTFEITDVKPIRGFRMESVAGNLRVVEQSAFRRAAYEEAKKKRQENIQKLLNEGLISEEDLTKAIEGETTHRKKPFTKNFKCIQLSSNCISENEERVDLCLSCIRVCKLIFFYWKL